MRELEVVGVRVEVPSNAPMLMLREVDGDRYLAVWIGAAEAASIANALEGLEPPRPLTHDLMAQMLTDLGHRELSGRVTDMRDGVFYAELEIDGQVISARPSDVVALAVRTQMSLTCPEDLLDRVGVAIEEEAEDEVEAFREFLDHVSAEDFDPDDEPGGR